jgi:hypothetical protein
VSEDGRQAGVWRAALALGGASVACLALAVVALALRPRTFSTHQDAIGYELVQRGIAYQAIYFERSWPDTLSTDRYSANVDLRLSSGRRVFGMIECRVQRKQCSFSLPSLDIMNEPLPELVPAEQAPWMVWLEQLWKQISAAAPTDARGEMATDLAPGLPVQV